MKTLVIGELETQFSEILERVQSGESFGIIHERKKKPIAMLVPYKQKLIKKDRQIGLLDGKVKIQIADDFKMSEKELLNLV